MYQHTDNDFERKIFNYIKTDVLTAVFYITM